MIEIWKTDWENTKNLITKTEISSLTSWKNYNSFSGIFLGLTIL